MKHPKLIKIIATIGMIILVMLIIAVGLKLVFPTLWDALKAGDEKGLEEFLKAAKGPKMLVFLFILQFVQIISIMLPSPPIHIAGGMVAGTLRAFTTCIISYTLANLFVFVCARKFHGKLNALESKENSKSSKLTEMLANSDPWIVVILACMVPIVPNGIIPYAAAQTPMKKSTFAASVFVGGFVPTFLLCAIGSNIMQADYPLILLLVSIDIICMWQVYDHKDDVVRIMKRIAALYNARKKVRAEEKAAKAAAKAEKEAEQAAQTEEKQSEAQETAEIKEAVNE